MDLLAPSEVVHFPPSQHEESAPLRAFSGLPSFSTSAVVGLATGMGLGASGNASGHPGSQWGFCCKSVARGGVVWQAGRGTVAGLGVQRLLGGRGKGVGDAGVWSALVLSYL